MEESKFFKTVWRFNALVIAIASVLAVILLVFVSYQIYKDFTRTKHKNEIVNIDPKTNIEEVFRLGQVEHVKGSESVIVPLYSDQSFDLGYTSKKSTLSTRNLLFTNISTGVSNWLLPENDYLILQHRLINESNTYNKKEDVVTILYRIVESDTNNDTRLTGNDKQTLFISNPNGSKFTEVLQNIDSFLGYELLNKETLAIVFQREKRAYIASVSLNDFKITKEIALPKID